MGANDWDLDAIVKGCCFTVPRSTTEPEEPFSNSRACTKEEQMDGQAAVTCFPDLVMTTTGIDELEELLKPFLQKQPLLSPQESSPLAAPAVIPRVHQIPQPKQHQQSLSQTLRSKGRKDQQKRVVCQVPVDGLSPDTWAWRKYGQKPIKGSPYPRGYYRCSSSKGCPARKQVEQSQTDPGVLVVTYTAEHNHSVPMQRHSLAGTTHHEFQPAPSETPDQTQVTSHSSKQLLHSGNPTSAPLLSSTAGGLSPTLTASTEDEIEHEKKMLAEDEVVLEDQLLDIQELERYKLAHGCSCCHGH